MKLPITVAIALFLWLLSLGFAVGRWVVGIAPDPMTILTQLALIVIWGWGFSAYRWQRRLSVEVQGDTPGETIVIDGTLFYCPTCRKVWHVSMDPAHRGNGPVQRRCRPCRMEGWHERVTDLRAELGLWREEEQNDDGDTVIAKPGAMN